MTDDFFRSRLDAMIDLRHPLAVLATRMPWMQIEASLAPLFGTRSFNDAYQSLGGGKHGPGHERVVVSSGSERQLREKELLARWRQADDRKILLKISAAAVP